MDKVLLTLSFLLMFTSCAEQYNIAGNSSVPCLDGRMLYLRVTTDAGSQNMQASSVCLDSCKVVHGRFNFVGDVDSVMLAMLYSGNQCVMPLVIENGNLNIQVDNVAQRVSGGPLNEKLYNFFKKRNRLDNELWELQQKTIRLMREGVSPEDIQDKMGKKAQELHRKTEELETKFVMDNYDNVLGPGFFMLLCSQYPSPIMTEQIRHIIQKAPKSFMNNHYVRNYVERAQTRITVQSEYPLPTEVTTTTTITFSCP